MVSSWLDRLMGRFPKVKISLVRSKLTVTVYQFDDSKCINNQDLLKILLVLNANGSVSSWGVAIPPGFAAISARQYEQLPDDLQKYFVEVEVAFDKK